MDGGRRGIGGNLLAQLEDGERDGDDEGEEGQLKSVPCFETQHADGQRHQGHCLEEDEDHNGDQDLADLVLLACQNSSNYVTITNNNFIF